MQQPHRPVPVTPSTPARMRESLNNIISVQQKLLDDRMSTIKRLESQLQILEEEQETSASPGHTITHTRSDTSAQEMIALYQAEIHTLRETVEHCLSKQHEDETLIESLQVTTISCHRIQLHTLYDILS